MARLNKAYFSMFKKKTLTFEEVKFNEDVRVNLLRLMETIKLIWQREIQGQGM